MLTHELSIIQEIQTSKSQLLGHYLLDGEQAGPKVRDHIIRLTIPNKPDRKAALHCPRKGPHCALALSLIPIITQRNTTTSGVLDVLKMKKKGVL